MDAKLKDESTNKSSLFFLVHLFLAILGFLIYIISFLLLQFYYAAPSLIRKFWPKDFFGSILYLINNSLTLLYSFI